MIERYESEYDFYAIVNRSAACRKEIPPIICLYNCHLSRLIKAKIFDGVVSFSNAGIRRPASGNHIIIGVDICITSAEYFLNFLFPKLTSVKDS